MNSEENEDFKNNKELRVRLSQKMWDMLTQIKDNEGFDLYTETTRYLIREKYKELMKKKLDTHE